MLATFIPPGQGSFKSRKFSTVDELVKVIAKTWPLES